MYFCSLTSSTFVCLKYVRLDTKFKSKITLKCYISSCIYCMPLFSLAEVWGRWRKLMACVTPYDIVQMDLQRLLNLCLIYTFCITFLHSVHSTLQNITSKSNLDLNINNTALPMSTHPKVLGLTLDIAYSTHIHSISVQAPKPLQMIKALTATGRGKQKETLMATYKTVLRPTLEYASSIWSPLASSTSMNKLHVMQH